MATPPHLDLGGRIPCIIQDLEGTGCSLSQSVQVNSVFEEKLREGGVRFQAGFERDWSAVRDSHSPSEPLLARTLYNLYRDRFDSVVRSCRLAILQIAAARMDGKQVTVGSFSDAASELLLAAYERNQRPSVGDRKHLAAACGLSVPQVNQWVSARH